MREIVGEIVNKTLGSSVEYLGNVIPSQYHVYFTFAVFTLLITIYALFVWNFYRFLARRDLLELNLAQYNRYDHAVVKKLLAAILYVLEYIIILPIVIFFWFFVMAFILLAFGGNQSIAQVALIAACIVGAVRITSYYSEDLSKDLAKLFPFTILAIALVTPGFVNVTELVARVSEIGNLFLDITFYLVVIMALELILRMLQLLTPEKEDKTE
ncbi:hypothetical protein J4477_00595 [Candidatus Pacearchaeota archaeon]|nr:hypothetical protein [Candidatus Pacearchaeota archaeon]